MNWNWIVKKNAKVEPVSRDIIESHANLYKTYATAFELRMKSDPKYVGSDKEYVPTMRECLDYENSFNDTWFPKPSGNAFGNELYEFVEYGSSGTSKYRDQYGRLVDFSVDDLVVACPYCRSKNNQHNFTCTQCGAPL